MKHKRAAQRDTLLCFLFFVSCLSMPLAAARVDVLRATGGLPAHISGAFQEPIAFQQAKSGRYYVFDRRAHTVYAYDAGAEAPKAIVRVGAEAGNILQPSA